MKVLVFVALCVILPCVVGSNLQYKVDLKQLPSVAKSILSQTSQSLKNKTVEAVKRDVDSHISLSKSVIRGLSISSQPKVSYKSHQFYVTVPQVEVDVAIEFMDNKNQQGKAEYKQRGKMLIWGQVDLTQEEVFFNISKAQVQMDIIDEDEISIT